MLVAYFYNSLRLFYFACVLLSVQGFLNGKIYPVPTLALACSQVERIDDARLAVDMKDYFNLLHLLDMSQISNLCDTKPVSIVTTLESQGREDVFVEQHTMESLGIRFNVIDYSRKGDNGRERVISIRGTKTLKNMQTNMDSTLIYDARLGFRVHKGYLEIATVITQELLNMKRKREAFLQEVEDITLSVTGHSMGGSVAIIVSMLLLDSYIKVQSCVTFGAPKFVDDMASNVLLESLNLIQVEHSKDPVCIGSTRVLVGAEVVNQLLPPLPFNEALPELPAPIACPLVVLMPTPDFQNLQADTVFRDFDADVYFQSNLVTIPSRCRRRKAIKEHEVAQSIEFMLGKYTVRTNDNGDDSEEVTAIKHVLLNDENARLFLAKGAYDINGIIDTKLIYHSMHTYEGVLCNMVVASALKIKEHLER